MAWGRGRQRGRLDMLGRAATTAACAGAQGEWSFRFCSHEISYGVPHGYFLYLQPLQLSKEFSLQSLWSEAAFITALADKFEAYRPSRRILLRMQMKCFLPTSCWSLWGSSFIAYSYVA